MVQYSKLYTLPFKTPPTGIPKSCHIVQSVAWSVHGPPWPGGDYKTGRYNEGERDLNRDFPTWRQVNQTRESLYSGRQPETQAMMDLIFGQVITTSKPRDLP